VKPTIFEPRLKFKPLLKFFKFGLWVKIYPTRFIFGSRKLSSKLSITFQSPGTNLKNSKVFHFSKLLKYLTFKAK